MLTPQKLKSMFRDPSFCNPVHTPFPDGPLCARLAFRERMKALGYKIFLNALDHDTFFKYLSAPIGKNLYCEKTGYSIEAEISWLPSLTDQLHDIAYGEGHKARVPQGRGLMYCTDGELRAIDGNNGLLVENKTLKWFIPRFMIIDKKYQTIVQILDVYVTDIRFNEGNMEIVASHIPEDYSFPLPLSSIANIVVDVKKDNALEIKKREQEIRSQELGKVIQRDLDRRRRAQLIDDFVPFVQQIPPIKHMTIADITEAIDNALESTGIPLEEVHVGLSHFNYVVIHSLRQKAKNA
jgi:hypothetical protein